MKPENREKCNWEKHIYYNPHGNLPFRVTIKVNSKLKHFGTFKELNDAIAVRDKILKQYPRKK